MKCVQKDKEKDPLFLPSLIWIEHEIKINKEPTVPEPQFINQTNGLNNLFKCKPRPNRTAVGS